jgi:alkylhydroperoxidase/carboxymuconolactone decarboxylase family protein YurZ
MTSEDIKRTMQQAMVTRVLEGDGRATQTDRRAAFDNTGLTTPLATLINKIAKFAYKVTDADMDAVKKAGLSEDQIFELVICAAVGQATRQYESALTALSEATGKE